MKYACWRLAPPCPEGRRALEEAGLPSLLAGVLSARGIAETGQARRLLSPEGEPIPDPRLLKDMDRAATRVQLALDRGELICVYGDYDVDGITATALLTQFLTGRGGRVLPYIPCRLEEGYGLNQEAVRTLAREGVDLIITVDCGITAVEETELARQLGMDVVITDHHTCKEELPAARAVVDPHRPDCPYPFKGLAGVGVALKLAMAVAGPEKAGAVFRQYRDLAAVGTVADVMPMTGENRTIVRQGLDDLHPPRRLGFAKLIECAGLSERPMTSVTVGYALAPRINASGRLGRAEVALELLLTQDPDRAEALAQTLCDLNRERQTIEGDIFQQCVQRLTEQPQSGAIVLADQQWHQGVVGIVASRLAEQFACPTFMVCLDQGMGKGSCRSWGGVNLFQMLQSCAPLLESFGGHAMAAGFTVREENIPALADALRRAVEAAPKQAASCLEADAAVLPESLTVPAVEELDLLEPWGAGNPRPVLVLPGTQVVSAVAVGRGRHLKLRLESRGVPLDAIWFSNDGAGLELEPGSRLDVAFCPQINEFRGLRSVQLQVMDLRPAPSRAQLERDVYEKFSRGEALSPAEAELLLPQRAEFVGLWRWLERRCGSALTMEDSLPHIARGAGRAVGRREAPVRTLVCLEVLEERGLIDLDRQTDRVRVVLHRLEHKVDLESSALLLRLRQAAEDRA